jgi:hypothetical protein
MVGQHYATQFNNAVTRTPESGEGALPHSPSPPPLIILINPLPGMISDGNEHEL